ncbi:hypothetical protein [Actinomadura rubteroloni]|uniref:hypothetical protein n=1 Tax=Actinomadura rubteroloni TaxID=1926885 RepID=UPI0011B0F2EB|nr:hypothetical protein [Actinomadura rubteroloni]
MGVDSTAILLLWIHEPQSRDFDLGDLVVLTAMTGDEWPETARMVSNCVLPLLREHRVRYVQVARAGPRQADGIQILDDSRSPRRLFVEAATRSAPRCSPRGRRRNAAVHANVRRKPRGGRWNRPSPVSPAARTGMSWGSS